MESRDAELKGWDAKDNAEVKWGCRGVKMMCRRREGLGIWSQTDKGTEVESGLLISSAVPAQRRMRVGGELTFCSIKLQLFNFCSVATLYSAFINAHTWVCVSVCYLRGGAGRARLPPSLSWVLLAQPWTWGCSEAPGADEDRQGDSWENRF